MNKRAMGVLTLVVVFAVFLVSGFSVVNAAGERVRDGSRCFTEEGVLDPLEQRVRWGQAVRDRLRDGTGRDGECQYEETGERLFLNRDTSRSERGLKDGSRRDGECQYEETGVRQFLKQGHGGGRGRNR